LENRASLSLLSDTSFWLLRCRENAATKQRFKESSMSPNRTVAFVFSVFSFLACGGGEIVGGILTMEPTQTVGGGNAVSATGGGAAGGMSTGGGNGTPAGGTASMAGGTATGGGQSATDAGTTVSCDFPAAVNALLVSKCHSCHGAGTQIPLVTRAQLLGPSSVATETRAQRSKARLHDTVSPMPPAYAAAASATEIAAFDAWVTGGTPMGTCTASADGGVPVVDAGTPGPKPTTCASNDTWIYGNVESPDMNPGLPCKACHVVQRPRENWAFMGTLFPALHEKNLCFAPPPANAVVEILDMAGVLRESIPVVNYSGNFYSAFYTNFPSPYKAQVRIGTRINKMNTPQTNGDCNSCHTEQGRNGAPGRIVAP
jgi:hypothetical protein